MKKVQTKDSTISPQKKEIDGLLEYFDIFTENCPLLVDSSILVALLDKIDRKDAPLSKLRSFDVDMVTRLATNLKLSESYVGMVKMDFNSAKKILITSSNDTKEQIQDMFMENIDMFDEDSYLDVIKEVLSNIHDLMTRTRKEFVKIDTNIKYPIAQVNDAVVVIEEFQAIITKNAMRESIWMEELIEKYYNEKMKLCWMSCPLGYLKRQSGSMALCEPCIEKYYGKQVDKIVKDEQEDLEKVSENLTTMSKDVMSWARQGDQYLEEYNRVREDFDERQANWLQMMNKLEDEKLTKDSLFKYFEELVEMMRDIGTHFEGMKILK